MIYAVKTIIGRENVVIEAMSNKTKTSELDIKVFVHPEEIKGYVFVEGELKDIDTVVFDGVITQRLVDIASERNVNYIVAARVSTAMKQPLKVKMMTFEEILA